MLGEPESVHIKGADEPVSARRLLAIQPAPWPGRAHRIEPGRSAQRDGRRFDAMVDRTIGGRGGVVGVVGPPGIGKSRMAREAAALAAGRGVEVFWAFCESHARDIPFHAVTRLLRAGTGVADLDGEAARARVRARLPDADPQDLLLLDDLLGIADPDVALPQIDPDARRRRLTALINAASLARTDTGAVHHRGCAVDRRGQRVDAGRLPHGDPADHVDGADHLPPRVRGCADAGARRPDDSACPTG